VFSTPLHYNRLTATFDELLASDGSERTQAPAPPSSSSLLAPFGATDAQRERMMLWAKKERLPMFIRHCPRC